MQCLPSGYIDTKPSTLTAGWLLLFSTGFVAASTPALEGPISNSLRLDPAQMGFVFGLGQLAWAAASLASGLLLDRYGLYMPTIVGSVLVAISPVVRAGAVDFGSLAVSVILWGIGSPLILIASTKLISDHFVGLQRAYAIGLSSIAPVLGNAVMFGAAYSVFASATRGWRGTVLASAIVPIASSLFWAIPAFTGRLPRPTNSGTRPGFDPRALASLIRLPNVALMIAASIAWLLVGHGLNNWIPAVLVSRGFGQADANSWAAFAVGVGILSALLFLRPISLRVAARLLAGLSAATALASLGLVFASGPLLLIALAITGIARSAATPLTSLIVMESPGVEKGRIGAAIGACLSIGQVGGFLGPWIVGVTAAQSKSFILPMEILAVVALILAVVVLNIRNSPTLVTVWRQP